ncbi:MAG TPA: rhomboid family intramembrane serine protease [Solirubrobacteraceae bacterium]|jgi:membrane associated rhomboid family serine protease
MTTTNVGMRCPECSKQRTKVVRLREMSKTPYVTYALIAINVIAFLAERNQFTLSGSAGGTVFNEGVLNRATIAVGHQYWRLVTSGFLHEDLLHIGFNMYLLYLLGLMLEPTVGSTKFAVVYFTSLLAGSFGVILSTSTATLGASGAIFGLMGYAAIELRARGHRVMETGIGTLIVFNLALSFILPDISIGAHVGGLIGGGLAGLAMKAADDRRAPALGYAACLLLSAAAVAGSIALASASGTGFA